MIARRWHCTPMEVDSAPRTYVLEEIKLIQIENETGYQDDMISG